MNKIASGDIKKGMRFSDPLFFDDGKNMFLAEGKSVKAYHVAALERWAVPFVLTKGHEMKGEELSRYFASAKKKVAPKPAPSQKTTGRKSQVKVDMDATADVTDMFADDVADGVPVAEADTNSSNPGIKTLKVEQELDAEDVTSMFM